MKKVILGKKIGMTQLFDESGNVIPVTVVQAGPCVIVRKCTPEKNGYSAILLGYGTPRKNQVTKPMQGVFNSANIEPVKYLNEFRVSDVTTYEVGQILSVAEFAVNDVVKVRGKTIGRGFTGTIKRWNFSRGPMTHGSKSHRITGSIGAGTTPGNVVKGKKMPGHYGHEYVTIRNLRVAGIDAEKNHIYITGALPGKMNTLLQIESAGK